MTDSNFNLSFFTDVSTDTCDAFLKELTSKEYKGVRNFCLMGLMNKEAETLVVDSGFTPIDIATAIIVMEETSISNKGHKIRTSKIKINVKDQLSTISFDKLCTAGGFETYDTENYVGGMNVAEFDNEPMTPELFKIHAKAHTLLDSVLFKDEGELNASAIYSVSDGSAGVFSSGSLSVQTADVINKVKLDNEKNALKIFCTDVSFKKINSIWKMNKPDACPLDKIGVPSAPVKMKIDGAKQTERAVRALQQILGPRKSQLAIRNQSCIDGIPCDRYTRKLINIVRDIRVNVNCRLFYTDQKDAAVLNVMFHEIDRQLGKEEKFILYYKSTREFVFPSGVLDCVSRVKGSPEISDVISSCVYYHPEFLIWDDKKTQVLLFKSPTVVSTKNRISGAKAAHEETLLYERVPPNIEITRYVNLAALVPDGKYRMSYQLHRQFVLEGDQWCHNDDSDMQNLHINYIAHYVTYHWHRQIFLGLNDRGLGICANTVVDFIQRKGDITKRIVAADALNINFDVLCNDVNSLVKSNNDDDTNAMMSAFGALTIKNEESSKSIPLIPIKDAVPNMLSFLRNISDSDSGDDDDSVSVVDDDEIDKPFKA